MEKLVMKIFLLVIVLLFSCKNSVKNNYKKNEINFNSTLGIEKVPSSLGSNYRKNFVKYTKVVAPNGKPIHIVAQSNLTDEQIVRSRSILEHYLHDYPGSQYGNDKSSVANEMANNRATLLLLNGADGENTVPNVDGQPLYEKEIQVEGNQWYVNQNYEFRDASYEEILHLVHDYGIGVDGPNAQNGALPDYQAEIRYAQQNAIDNNFAIWPIGADGSDQDIKNWYNELSRENSLSQEYLASLIDSYYGLWGAFGKGMWGIYIAKDREEIASKDPVGMELLNNKFFHPYITYNARIDSGFTGTFSLKFDSSIPYTHHSRYLKDITLLGSENTDIIVNELDNDITGNNGINTVIFSGNQNDYSISNTDDILMVKDNRENSDGTNHLKNIEKLQFSDQIINLE